MRLVVVSQHSSLKQDALSGCRDDELVLAVDADRCIACGSCALACQAEHAPFGQPSPVRRLAAGIPPGQKAPRIVSLPTSCRQCRTPCACDTGYAFWTVCPAEKAHAVAAQSLYCDCCEQRLRAGLNLACVTRCSMKCLYAGTAADIRFVLEEKRLRSMGETEMCRCVPPGGQDRN